MLAFFFYNGVCPPKKNPLISPFRDGQPAVSGARPHLCVLWKPPGWTVPGPRDWLKGKHHLSIYPSIYLSILYIYVYILFLVFGWETYSKNRELFFSFSGGSLDEVSKRFDGSFGGFSDRKKLPGEKRMLGYGVLALHDHF